jgi:hypothetical protein
MLGMDLATDHRWASIGDASVAECSVDEIDGESRVALVRSDWLGSRDSDPLVTLKHEKPKLMKSWRDESCFSRA